MTNILLVFLFFIRDFMSFLSFGIFESIFYLIEREINFLNLLNILFKIEIITNNKFIIIPNPHNKKYNDDIFNTIFSENYFIISSFY